MDRERLTITCENTAAYAARLLAMGWRRDAVATHLRNLAACYPRTSKARKAYEYVAATLTP